jgi:hypothetical protein
LVDLAVVVLSLSFVSVSVAEPREDKKKSPLSQDEVWKTYPYRDKETFEAFEVCGDPIEEGAWEGDTWVSYTRLCVKLSVRQECKCRKFNTTYRKLKGATTYNYWSIGDSEEVPCISKLPDDKQAACDQKLKADSLCETEGKSYSVDGWTVVLSCPSDVPYDNSDYGDNSVEANHCKKCKVLDKCNEKFPENVQRYKDFCKTAR